MDSQSPDANFSEDSMPRVPAAVDEAEMMSLPTDMASSNNDPIAGRDGEDDLRTPLDTVEQEGFLPTADTGASTSSGATGHKPALPTDRVSLPTRPSLRRDKSVPSSPQQLPPPPAPIPPPSQQQPHMDPGNPENSLSLMQFRRLVAEMPKVEPTPYAFEYTDASSMPEELEEWFTYGVEERARVFKTLISFKGEWEEYHDVWAMVDGPYFKGKMDWSKADEAERATFVERLLRRVHDTNMAVRLTNLEALTYLMFGAYQETAGADRESTAPADQADGGAVHSAYRTSPLQIQWIRRNAKLIFNASGLQTIYDIMRSACLRECMTSMDQDSKDGREEERREMWCAMTIMYFFLEAARTDCEEGVDSELRDGIITLQPQIMTFLMDIIARLRWDESIGLPLMKILLLLWKSILVVLGGITDVDRTKASFRDETLETEDRRGQPLITASPLDYHLFRQEISSKYPAYNPPPPLFPLEPENNSILPPLKNHPSKATGSNIFGAGTTQTGTSILHQPVHIATPVPSPPPSPAGPGGKGGKKHNYQTNQLFPFMYPPLDESSNNLGGKGSTDLQDILVGRKWKGSDIPASILEAAELFAKRMRATRAMKQLWEERVEFMKYERGWSASYDEDVEDLDLSSDLKSSSKGKGKVGRLLSTDIETRLKAVEELYKTSLPHLQSVVIVLLKVVLSNVTSLITQANGSNGLQGPFQFHDGQNGNLSRQDSNLNGNHPDIPSPSTEELDAMRSQEILAKAVSGILILLLKWFKVSHILKFEYLTQLLLDSNYIPLILKLLQTQELERVVNYKCDREDINFFQYCLSHSRHRPRQKEEEPELADSDSDDAAPPPIKRQRSPPPKAPDPPQQAYLHPPEVDDLGKPMSDFPPEPITNFSWRNFFSSINWLRVMQKICKNKAHRNLLLVQYKSSGYLKKSLKVPQPLLRLYALKLFKNQVPYCGRKWRQSNMRVITAVYLHCRPDLRDDWLAGSDVDADVEESVPLEQALRALTHWHNLKRYPEMMGAEKGILEEEQDFFVRELEKMEWAEESMPPEEIPEQWEGQMHMEGW
ncbi:hypothetical protein BDY21DRAFT_352876 [Lineolata rhizophorae]|uniref:Protein required for hyphal anastomosis n=1 Tax=Lineolata rhizophorae TaxID=578093 RepID=A0A6A6NRU3_9PEZI|nr:hypothetical protein BDY21DRAFT_352876 [Lineolata rhizophorae]